MAETRNYTGGCHCGEVRFEVTAEIVDWEGYWDDPGTNDPGP